MHEIELKLQVPAERRVEVRRAVSTASAQQTRLQARYYDTEDRRLAAAGLALRLRKEGRRWVQALKAPADATLVRFEHEVDLGGGASVPGVDAARHAGTPAGERLAQLLAGEGAALQELFVTDVRRTWRRLRPAAGSLVEIAFDEGVIRAGERSLPLCELEFELLRGSATELARVAKRWALRFGLWLDTRSKAARGAALAHGHSPPPARSRLPPLHRRMSGAEALRAMAAEALRQVLDNASELAAAPASPEHLHQLRVGLRRLATAVRDFAVLDATGAPPTEAWQSTIRTLSRALGATRDLDALNESVLPALAAAGAPVLALPVHDGPDVGELLRAPAATALWLDLLGWLHAPAQASPQRAEQLRASLGEVLEHLHRAVVKDAARFGQLTPAGQHRTRKRIKRLRYGAEFCTPLFPPKAVTRYLAALRPAQAALGEAHDLVVAEALFAQQVSNDPRAWFALGWLSARRQAALGECSAALQALAAGSPFWQGKR